MSQLLSLAELQADLEKSLGNAERFSPSLVVVFQGALEMLCRWQGKPTPEHLAHVQGTAMDWADLERFEREFCHTVEASDDPQLSGIPGLREAMMRASRQRTATYQQLQREAFERMMAD